MYNRNSDIKNNTCVEDKKIVSKKLEAEDTGKQSWSMCSTAPNLDCFWEYGQKLEDRGKGKKYRNLYGKAHNLVCLSHKCPYLFYFQSFLKSHSPLISFIRILIPSLWCGFWQNWHTQSRGWKSRGRITNHVW